MKIVVACGPEFRIEDQLAPCSAYVQWADWVAKELDAIQLKTAGLGPGFLRRGYGTRTSRCDARWWVALVNERLSRRPVAGVELRPEPAAGLEREDGTDRHWLLGSYCARRRVIALYPQAIARAAAGLPLGLRASARDVLRVVLLHELGHHVSPGDDHERRAYNSAKADAATSRLETAAQAFAWLTSDAEGRALLEHLSQGVSPAYRAYQALFGQASSCSGSPRLGWLSAWQLSQFPSCADLPLPQRSVMMSYARWRAFLEAVSVASLNMHGMGVEPWAVLTFDRSASGGSAGRAASCLRPGDFSMSVAFFRLALRFDSDTALVPFLGDRFVPMVNPRAGSRLLVEVGLAERPQDRLLLRLRVADDVALQSGRVDRYLSRETERLTNVESLVMQSQTEQVMARRIPAQSIVQGVRIQPFQACTAITMASVSSSQ